jgi:hypothetical protein
MWRRLRRSPSRTSEGSPPGHRVRSGHFVKVTKVCNDYYCASAKEYDNVTGLGVPDVAKIVNALVALP